MPSTLYDDDVLVWSERQAALLRALRTRRDLPNELDIDNVAEEIESVGRSELQAVESYLVLVLAHAIKIASVDRPDLVQGWLGEMGNFQLDASLRQTPSMPARIDVERVWRSALKRAANDLRRHGDRPVKMPARCPISLDILLADDFDADAVVEMVRAAAAAESGVFG